MFLQVDPHSGVPVYRQIIDQVKFLIAGGLLRPGDELPSTRSLAVELGLNPMTVSKAYSFLERDGLLEHNPGRPLTVRLSPDGRLEAARIERLRDSLRPAARAVRQLGIPIDDAIRTFNSLLDDASQEDS